MKHEAEQLGLFDNAVVRNKSADEPWKKSETAKMLDSYLAGARPERIAQELGRNPKAVKRRLEQFTYNEFDRAVRYEPFRRASRSRMRLTENERLIIKAHRERNVPIEATAKVLARDANEIDPNREKDAAQVTQRKEVAASLDLVLAYRYIYFTYKKKIISNKTYDDLKAEEIEFGNGSYILGDPKRAPGYIKSLALYLVGKHEEQNGKTK